MNEVQWTIWSFFIYKKYIIKLLHKKIEAFASIVDFVFQKKVKQWLFEFFYVDFFLPIKFIWYLCVGVGGDVIGLIGFVVCCLGMSSVFNK